MLIKFILFLSRKNDKYYSKNMINKLRRNKTKENNIKKNKSISLKSLKLINHYMILKILYPKLIMKSYIK